MSRTKEQRAYDSFSRRAQKVLRLWRMETINTGMADVIGKNERAGVFWLEMKALDDWPKRPTTFPLKGAFEKGQIGFLKEWGNAGGHGFVLLRVGESAYYLFDPKNVDGDLRTMTREDLVRAAVVFGVDAVIEYLARL